MLLANRLAAGISLLSSLAHGLSEHLFPSISGIERRTEAGCPGAGAAYQKILSRLLTGSRKDRFVSEDE